MKFNLFGGDPAKQFMEQHQKACQLSNTGKYKEALPMHEKCLKIAAQGNLPLIEDQLLTVWQNITTCHFQLDDYEATLRYCRGTISLLEEWNTARQPGKNTGNELSKNKSVAEWKSLVPDGLEFGFRQSFDPTPTLAYTYKVAGSAYMYAKKYDQGLDYYKKAIGAYKQLNQPNETAQIWMYVANEFKRREDWDKTEKAAQNALVLGKQINDSDIQLTAGRFLVDKQIAVGETVEALDTLAWMIPMGRQNRNIRSILNEETLDWVSEKIRATAKVSLDTTDLQALVATDRALRLPNYDADTQLLAQIQKAVVERERTPRDGTLRSLSDINDVVKAFAELHCEPGKWSTGAEDMDEFDKSGHQVKQVGVMLYLSHKPETFVRITLQGDSCQVAIMQETKIPLANDKFLTGYKGAKPQSVPARADALLQFLNGYISTGALVKQGGQLVFMEGKQ